MSETAKFVTGSTMRHVIVMAATGSVGLVAVFLVDALNLFYISLLGQQELAAAIGYAGTLIFFTTSISIGLAIASTAITSRAIGAGQRERARELATTSLIYTAAIMALAAVACLPYLDAIVHFLGARDETARLTVEFLLIVFPSMPLLGIGMCMSGLLRAAGDAKRAMYVTLFAGAATAVLDPILIFGFDLGIHGAAISTVITRFVLIFVGFYGLQRIHNMLALPSLPVLTGTIRPYLYIGLPAIMTQLATPVGNAYMTIEIAGYGDAAVAGWAVVGRLIPVAFGALFALSGAVGPILGQNYGALRFDRLYSTMRNAFVVIIIYTLAVWLLLFVGADYIAALFGVDGEAGDMVIFFCEFVSLTFLFTGMLFVANAAFNNLGYPLMSTIFNWGRSTLGVIPFVWIGSHYYGALGALAGYGLGAVFFGIAAAITCLRIIRRIAEKPPSEPPPPAEVQVSPAANSPFTSGKGAT
ncbi:MATE family efflux transporter [Nitratireductor sp. XY-223]|uniref:MATE family efflux transporter n=1 Tax=Nitratireductor sp. XY-223 TaxID=2561926 RepID=UPI001FEE7315|nr:MATE family efflux transporter [Nitratireductor sp. XY-223]